MAKKPPSILVVGSRYGGGHKSAADNIIATLKKTHPKYTIHYLDFGEIIGETLDSLFVSAYDMNVKYMPSMHRIGASIFDSPYLIQKTTDLYSPVAKLYLERKLKLYKPNLLVITFPTANRLIETFKQKYNFRMLTVITDLTSIHSYWISNQIDKYLVGTSEMIPHLQIHGVDPRKIKVTGFSVAPAYFAKKSTKTLRKKYKLKNKFTVLYLLGSSPDKFAPELAVELDKHFQLILACGKNTALQKKISPKLKNAHIIGYTKHLDEYMRVAHVCVGKAGPGFLMECATLGRPVVLTNYLAPQEYGNVEMVLRHRWGYYEPSATRALRCIQQLSHFTPAKYSALCQRALRINQKNSTAKIVRELDKFL